MKKALQDQIDFEILCEQFDHSGFTVDRGYSYAEFISCRNKKSLRQDYCSTEEPDPFTKEIYEDYLEQTEQ